jgi:hypothetical protein
MSLVLATLRNAYIDGLTAFRYTGDPLNDMVSTALPPGWTLLCALLPEAPMMTARTVQRLLGISFPRAGGRSTNWQKRTSCCARASIEVRRGEQAGPVGTRLTDR